MRSQASHNGANHKTKLGLACKKLEVQSLLLHKTKGKEKKTRARKAWRIRICSTWQQMKFKSKEEKNQT